MTNWTSIRQREFPSFEHAIHLKAAGGSPMCLSAHDEVARYLHEMTYAGDLYFGDYLEKVNRTRAQVARYLGASADEIAFTTNSSTGATLMAELLVRADVERVYFPAFEFPTSIHALLHRRLELVPLGDLTENTTSAHWLAQLERHSDENPPKKSALVGSHVSFLNGAVLDVSAAAEVCARQQMIFVLNATQSFGALEIDVDAPVQLLFATGLKWACAGYGAGVLYLRRSLVDQLGLPAATGWLSVDDPYRMNNMNHLAKPCASALDAGGGMPHFPSLLGLHGALTLYERIGDGEIRAGVAQVQQRVVELATQLQTGLLDAGFELLGGKVTPRSSGIVSIVTPHADALFQRLSDQGILISKRHHPVGGTGDVLRFGVHFYNTAEDLDAALQVVREFR